MRGCGWAPVVGEAYVVAVEKCHMRCVQCVFNIYAPHEIFDPFLLMMMMTKREGKKREKYAQFQNTLPLYEIIKTKDHKFMRYATCDFLSHGLRLAEHIIA